MISVYRMLYKYTTYYTSVQHVIQVYHICYKYIICHTSIQSILQVYFRFIQVYNINRKHVQTSCCYFLDGKLWSPSELPRVTPKTPHDHKKCLKHFQHITKKRVNVNRMTSEKCQHYKDDTNDNNFHKWLQTVSTNDSKYKNMHECSVDIFELFMNNWSVLVYYSLLTLIHWYL